MSQDASKDFLLKMTVVVLVGLFLYQSAEIYNLWTAIHGMEHMGETLFGQ